MTGVRSPAGFCGRRGLGPHAGSRKSGDLQAWHQGSGRVRVGQGVGVLEKHPASKGWGQGSWLASTARTLLQAGRVGRSHVGSVEGGGAWREDEVRQSPGSRTQGGAS